MDLDVRSEHNFFTTRTKDISEGGLFLASTLPLAMGSRVGIHMVLADEPIDVEAEVMWTLTDQDGATEGIGVRFVELTRTAQRAIRRYMRMRDPFLFDVEAAAAQEDPAVEAPEPVPPPLPKRS